jgi:hypothetical protein
MTIRIEPATLPTLQHIAERLRDVDRQELLATGSEAHVLQLPRRVMTHHVSAFVAIDSERGPVAAWGLLELWPGVGAAFAFGTDGWGLALRAMTKHVREFMIPMVIDAGYHRIEAKALAHRRDVERWVSLFGATPEGLLRSAGKRGEDLVQYRWLAHDYQWHCLNRLSGRAPAATD